MCVCARARIYTYVYTYVCTHAYTYEYTYECIYTCTRSFIVMHVLLNYIDLKPIN